METTVNTEKDLLSKEYGSNILKLVEYLLTIENIEERTIQAELLKKLIFKMNPSLKYTENADEKVWNAMYILSNCKLDVNVDYNKVDPEVFHKKPLKIDYSINRPKYKHYGKNIELIIEKILAETNEEKRKDAIIGLGKLMKIFYGNWNKEITDNNIIVSQISNLSNGKIIIPAELLEDQQIFDTKKMNKNNINQNHLNANQNSNNHRNNNGNGNRKNNNRNKINRK